MGVCMCAWEAVIMVYGCGCEGAQDENSDNI